MVDNTNLPRPHDDRTSSSRKLPYPPGSSPQSACILRSATLTTVASVQPQTAAEAMGSAVAAPAVSLPMVCAQAAQLDTSFRRACNIPLPWAGIEENMSLSDDRTVMRELEEGGHLNGEDEPEEFNTTPFTRDELKLALARLASNGLNSS